MVLLKLVCPSELWECFSSELVLEKLRTTALGCDN